MQKYFCLPCGHLGRAFFVPFLVEPSLEPSDPSLDPSDSSLEPSEPADTVSSFGLTSPFGLTSALGLTSAFGLTSFAALGVFLAPVAFCFAAFGIGGSTKAASPGSLSRSTAASATSRSKASAAAEAAGIARRHSVSSCAHANESPCAATRYISALFATPESVPSAPPSAASSMNAVTSAMA